MLTIYLNSELYREIQRGNWKEESETEKYGSSGVGKTHLAIALGVAAARKRNLTYFITGHDLIQQ